MKSNYLYHKVLIITILIFFFIGCSTNKTITRDINIKWIPFKWNESIIGKDTLKYGSIELISNIKGIDEKVGMQFDLGSTITVLYENPIKNITKDSLSYPFNVDWKNKGKFAGHEAYNIRNLKISSNGYKFENLTPGLLKNYGSIKDSGMSHIGTIGLDAVKNKILIIDYKNQKIGISDSLPKKILKKVNFVNFEKTEIKQTVIKINVNNKNYNILFDTGSSSWTIITGEKRFKEKLGNTDVKLDSIEVSSWGRKEYFYSSPIEGNISIANKKYKNIEGYFFKDNQTSEYLYKNDILAIVGNRLFIENSNTVIIDYKNNKFGIVE